MTKKKSKPGKARGETVLVREARSNAYAWIAIGALGLTMTAATGCRKTAAKKAPSSTATASASGAVTAAELTKARSVFKSTCSTCHGVDGRGDGPGAATLTPKPRNFHDKAWQAKVTDAHIEKTLLYGGAAVGLSPVMPAHPELQNKPTLDKALVAVVRAFGGAK